MINRNHIRSAPSTATMRLMREAKAVRFLPALPPLTGEREGIVWVTVLTEGPSFVISLDPRRWGLDDSDPELLRALGYGSFVGMAVRLPGSLDETQRRRALAQIAAIINLLEAENV